MTAIIRAATKPALMLCRAVIEDTMKTIHLFLWANEVPGGAGRRPVDTPSDAPCITTKAASTVIPQPERLALVFAALKIKSATIRI